MTPESVPVDQLEVTLKSLELKPGHVFVVEVPQTTQMALNHIIDVVRRARGPNIPVFITTNYVRCWVERDGLKFGDHVDAILVREAGGALVPLAQAVYTALWFESVERRADGEDERCTVILSAVDPAPERHPEGKETPA